MTGHDRTSSSPKPQKAQAAEKRPEPEKDDLTDALEDSFPASDPPSMTQPGKTAEDDERKARAKR